MSKRLTYLLLFVLLPAFSWAQTSVPAAEIVAKINRGEAVSYQNATITGDLDLTQLQNKTLQKPKGENDKYDSKEYLSTVTAPVSFINCTFKGDVLAYFNPNSLDGDVKVSNVLRGKGQEEVYNTNFEQQVRFEKCVFERRSAFKYSAFKGDASFAGSTFQNEALFKYAQFNGKIDFEKARFNEVANFKYVKFPSQVDFKDASFRDEALFKYAAFPKGADFQRATFTGLANFKYAKLADPVQWKGATFKGGQDLKYTSMNQKSFSAAALDEMAR
ncbi:pentapeptide repeat-containing protein [Rufibacter sediminis]|uniref:Pentapeptide repeat-containing protein n=1 Tax=Rufibacter sediminis TaxID=2762756 RepID=A0ABR6VRQ8_9BACT|nr:pentapeptide repeat-containing protein [Rufibacter sediminis]MBC3539884.1 pentapeptide repeat-containing protein [Rufibacter sediminis]